MLEVVLHSFVYKSFTFSTRYAILTFDFIMNTLYLFNALTQTLEEFVPSNPHDVKIYCCGPTVYDVPHLGHARTYVFLDVLRRILRHHLGFGVRSVMNVTNLDDKIIEKGGPRVADQYEWQFFETMDRLNVERPDFAPRVTDFLNYAHSFSKSCVVQEFAYYTPGFDTTYFSTEAYLKHFDRVFPHTVKRDNPPQQSRVEETEKKWDPRDFALWKNSKMWVNAKGEEQRGMPGWHTECATMASYYFKDYVDIHLGGIDLQFPHHENEIALGRVYLGKKDWVRFCLYTGHLQTDGKKMSKSLKNFTTVDEMLEEKYSPLAIRYMFLKFPYDKPMNFNKDEMKKAQKSYENFMHDIEQMQLKLLELKTMHEAPLSHTECNHLNYVKKQIDTYLKDNMNVSEALKTLEDYVKKISSLKQPLQYEWLQYVSNYVLWMADTCFGLIAKPSKKSNPSDALFPILKDFRRKVREVALMEDINQAQQESLLKLCDTVRIEMTETGYTIEDGNV